METPWQPDVSSPVKAKPQRFILGEYSTPRALLDTDNHHIVTTYDQTFTEIFCMKLILKLMVVVMKRMETMAVTMVIDRDHRSFMIMAMMKKTMVTMMVMRIIMIMTMMKTMVMMMMVMVIIRMQMAVTVLKIIMIVKMMTMMVLMKITVMMMVMKMIMIMKTIMLMMMMVMMMMAVVKFMMVMKMMKVKIARMMAMTSSQLFLLVNHKFNKGYFSFFSSRVRSGTSDDEMCNFYIMYYMDHKHVVPFMNCMETGEADLFQNIPAEANVPIPVSAEHLHSPMHMGHPAGAAQQPHDCLQVLLQ